MKMILVHNWIIRQTSLHALLVPCFPLHNIAYNYIFQVGLMNNVLLDYKVKDWDLHSTVSNEFRRALNLCTLIQDYKLIGLRRMSKAQRTSEAILEFTFHCEYTEEFGKTVNFHVSETSGMISCCNIWYTVDD